MKPEPDLSHFDDAILDYAEAQRRKQDAITSVNGYLGGSHSLQQALDGFQQFVTYCTAEKRWLFGNGEPLKLPRDTQFIRLLPHIASFPPNERLVLCVYPAANQDKPALQLLQWTREKGRSQLKLISDTPFPVNIEASHLDPPPRLNEKTCQIELVPAFGKLFMLKLVYNRGQVEVLADDQGIRDARWIDHQTTDNAPPQTVERSSQGKMPAILRIEQAYEEKDGTWKDNKLWDARRGNAPINTQGHITGIIKGADSDGQANSDGIWFCTNQAHAWFWQPETQQLLQSKRLGSTCHDILNIPTPGIYSASSHSAAIVPTGDGRIYVLGKQENTLEIHGYQAMPQHILRVIGDGGNLILVVDANQNIYPISIDIDKGIIDTIRGLADKLTVYMEEHQLLSQWENTPEGIQQFGQQLFPLLIHALLTKAGAPPLTAYPITAIRLFFQNYLALQTHPKPLVSLTAIHNDLLSYLWGWLQGQTNCAESRKSTTISPFLSELLQAIVVLPDEAPDLLWLSLFRHHPLLDKVFSRKKLSWYSTLQMRTIRCRQAFSASINQIRPIQVENSYYLDGQARHLRILDQNHVCFVDYQTGLQVWRISPGDEQREWKRVWKQAHDEDWQGLPCSIHAGSALNKALLGKAEDDRVGRILLTTNRGEVRLYESKDTQHCTWQLIGHTDIGMDIRAIEPFHFPQLYGLVLGGQDPQGRACLQWLTFADLKSPRTKNIRWYDEAELKKGGGGSIRMLTSQASGEEILLWGVDQERGKLYQWNVGIAKGASDTSNIPRLKANPKIILDNQRHLYALSLNTGLDGHIPTLICGGVNGHVFGIDPRHDTVRWVTGCGKTIKRTVYLPLLDKWLLCGEHSSIFVARNKDGKITDILERLGPISTSRAFAMDTEDKTSPYLVLSGKNGRLILLKSTPSARKKSSTEVPAFNPLYPLQTTNNSSTVPALDCILSEKPFLLDQEVLIYKQFINNTLIKQDILSDALKTFLGNQSSSRLAWLLYQKYKKGKNTYPTLDYLMYFWEQLGKRGKLLYDTPCQIVAALLRILALPQTPITELNILRNKLLGCLWSSNCPPNFENSERIRGLRLGVLSWLYHKASHEYTAVNHPDITVNQWFFLIWKTLPDQLQDQENFLHPIKSLLPDIHLFFPQTWKTWLLEIVENETTTTKIPCSLSALQNSKPLPVTTQQQLTGLFRLIPKTSREEWEGWLQSFTAITNHIEELEHSKSRILWKKHQSLIQLLTLFNAAQRNLTFEKGFPLFALWYNNVQDIILQNIQQQISELSNTPLSPELLCIQVSAKWHHANNLDIHFMIQNYFCKELILDSINIPALPQHHEQQTLHGSPLPLVLPTRESATTLDWHGIKTLQEDHLFAENVTLKLRERETGKPHRLTMEIKFSRAIRTFNQEPRWQPNWLRLETLLKNYQHHAQAFVWIDGHYWSNAERERLKLLVQEQYQINFDKDIVLAANLGDALSNANGYAIFCPDLPLGEENAANLIDNFHSALHKTDLPEFQLWALYLWHKAQRPSNSIDHALTHMMEDIQGKAVLERLGIAGNLQKRLYAGIQALPPRAIGDWCSGDPIYAEAYHQTHDPDLYTTPYLYFPCEVWQALSHITADGLNAWLQPKPDRKLQEHDRAYLIANNHPAESSLIRKLTHSLVGERSWEKQSYWECTGFHPALTLLDDDYQRIYLFTTDITDTEIKHLDHYRIPTVCLIFTDTPLGHNFHRRENQQLQYFHLPSAMLNTLALAVRHEQLTLLNRIAATQLGIPSDKIFRTVGGMTEKGLQRHFYGRDNETAKLMGMVKSGYGGYLIIGGRRMGKTSLRQYFELRINQDLPQYPCISINCEKLTTIKGPALEKWFIEQLVSGLRESGKLPEGVAIWPEHDRLAGLTHEQVATARHNLEKRLRTFGTHPAIIVIDETEHLIRQDSPSLAILHWLRALVTERLVMLVMTSYPHGKQHQYALPSLLRNAGSPLYNFVEPITLQPWTIQETWHFIHDKLQLLGIALPHDLRLPLLNLTQGVPWIVNYVGQQACTHVRHGIITEAHWVQIKANTLKAIRNTFKEIVQKIAEDYDRSQNDFDKSRDYNEMQQHLWPALAAIARQRDTRLAFTHSQQWQQEIEFTDADVLQHYGKSISLEKLRETLSQFTDTGLLKGFPTDAHKFSFANNLFPMIAAEKES